MKTKKQINDQITHCVKLYEHTKDFEEFRKNVSDIIQEIEEITPVSPFSSTYLFRVKMDCENMDQFNAGSVILSLETFLEKLAL